MQRFSGKMVKNDPNLIKKGKKHYHYQEVVKQVKKKWLEIDHKVAKKVKRKKR